MPFPNNTNRFPHDIHFVTVYVLWCGFCELLLGEDDSRVCEDDGGRFQKTSSSQVLSVMGGLHSETEVEFNLILLPSCVITFNFDLASDIDLFIICS